MPRLKIKVEKMDNLRNDLDFNIVAYLPLTRGKISYFDKDDFGKLAKYRWCASPCGKVFYPARKKEGNKYVFMHQEIIGIKENFVIDHINNDTFDNRKINLRFVPRWFNLFNTRKVYNGYYKKNKKFIARVKINNKSRRLGIFKNKNEAHEVSIKFITERKNMYISSEEYIRNNLHLFHEHDLESDKFKEPYWAKNMTNKTVKIGHHQFYKEK